MNERLADALQSSLEALERGEDLEQVLSAYPQLKADLRPLLEIVQRTSQLDMGEVPDEIAARSRARLLAQAKGLRNLRAGQRFPPWLPRLAAAALIVLALVISGAGLYIASAQALPGDALYPIKRAAEGLHINLAPSADRKLTLSLSYSQRRVDEILSLLDQGRHARVRFVGALDQRGGDRLQIQGVPVLLQETTIIETELAVGQILRVEGRTAAAGFVFADRIERGGEVITGIVHEAGSEAVQINDALIRIVHSSYMDPDIRIGDRVRATVRFERGHSVAVRVERLPSATATPAAVSPTAQPSEKPSAQDHDPAEQELRFEGIIEHQEAARWRISGRWISISTDTELKGDPSVGDQVEVRALAGPDGSWIAERIERIDSDDDDGAEVDEESDDEGDEGEEEEEQEEEVRLEGQVDSMESGSWVIDGQQVSVDDQTKIEGNVQVGDFVEVRALRRADGTLYAERIKREE